MFSVFHQHKLLTIIVVLLIVLGIVCQIIIGVLYQNMIKATDNMTATENKLLKQCKMKFMNCYKMNGGVINISVFVDKFMTKIRICGIRLTSISHLGGQLILLSVLCNGMGICRMLVDGAEFMDCIPFYVLSASGLYIYFGVTSFVDATERKKELKINLIDYLENHMSIRLANVETLEKDVVGEKKEKPKKNVSMPRKSKEDEAELQCLLKEFFIT